jgi:outer membrane receptor for ferrienterochelin and colicins
LNFSVFIMKKAFLKSYIFYLPLLLSGIVHAQPTGSVAGQVHSSESREILPGANVQIVGTFLGASSDANGFYEIRGITPGHYTLQISYIGFKPGKVAIQIKPQETLQVNVSLKPSPIPVNQIIITSSRQPEELASAAASVSVLDKDGIQRRNSFRIDEALLSVPGLTVIGENVNIRGGSGYNRLGGSRMLVLLDEVPILTSDLGAANWNILPVTEIEHIEVLKGAASSLYGSGALSGVVNIITKKPSRSHSLSFRQSAGIYDQPSVSAWKWTNDRLYYHRTDASYSSTFGPVGLRLAVSHHQSTGDRENGYFNRWYLTGKTLWNLPDQSTLTFYSTYSNEDRNLFLQWLEQNKALNVPPTDSGDRIKLTGYVGYIVYQKLFSPTFSTKIRVSYNQQLVGLPFNITSAFTPALGLSGELQFNWKPHEDHSLSLGMDYKRDMVESLYYGKRRANGLSPYFQEIWKLSQLFQVNAGLRWDTYTLVGDSVETQISPKIGASYQPFWGTIFHCSVGRGFRAATVVERFITAGSKDFRALPNPDLQPERSTLVDLGVRQSIGASIYAEVSAFYNRYNNLIEPTLSSDFTAQFKNYPTARVWGLESELRWHLWRDRLSLQASATWMDPKELQTGEPLLYRPRFIAYFAPSLSLGPFVLEVNYRYMSRIQRVAVFPLDERVPTKVWDASCGYRWRWLLFQLNVKNLLNYNYTISERVLGEIRNFALTVSGEL